METISQRIGRRLKILRNTPKPKISRTKLANDLGLARRTIDSYESGSINVPCERVFQLAKYFDVSMEYFISDKEPGGR